jgi:DUF4097 and DUF4098 domain-containing protein YvlB
MAGPVVLIAVGLGFLLTTMGVFQWEMLGPLFARYWPLLLILWGIIKLFEYQQAQRAGTRPPGIGVGGIFLIIMVIFVGLAVTGLMRVNWRGLGMDESDFPWFGQTYTFDDQVEQDFPAAATLRVNNERGAITVSASDGPKLRIVVHKRLNGSSQGEADRKNEKTSPQINSSPSLVTVDVKTQSGADRVDMDIYVPRKAPIVVSTRRGDISVLGRDADVEISSQKGDVSLADINGKAVLKLEDSSARVSQVSSDVTVDGHVNDISLEDIKGSVRLNGEFSESIRLSKLARSFSLKSGRTELDFAKLDGDVDLDAHDFSGNGITGPLRLTTKFKDIRLDGISGDVRLENENGAVEIRMTKLGSTQVDNQQGDVEIYVPDKAGFQVNARARNGDIQSDFTGLSVTDHNDTATASGKVGSGGPTVVINNEHGSIEIRKRSSLAEGPPPPLQPGAPQPPEATDN